MGIVKSTIYSTTAKEAMTQLNFSTDFEGQTAAVTIDFLKEGKKVTSQTYTINASDSIAKVALTDANLKAEGTLTFAAEGNAVAFSGVAIQSDVVSFLAENVAIAYR